MHDEYLYRATVEPKLKQVGFAELSLLSQKIFSLLIHFFICIDDRNWLKFSNVHRKSSDMLLLIHSPQDLVVNLLQPKSGHRVLDRHT